MSRLRSFGVGLLMLSLCTACGDDAATDGASPGAAGAGGGSGGSGGGGGSAAGIGGAGGGMGAAGAAADPGACSASEPATVLADVMLDHLTATADGVVFIDRTAGVPFRTPGGDQTGALRSLDRDGSNDSVLYEPEADRLLVSLAVRDDQLFFLEDRDVGPGQPDDVALYQVALAGGTPTLIGSLERGLAQTTELIAVDADAAYVNFGEDGLLRVALADGAVSQISAERILHNAVLVSDNIYYTTSPEIGMRQLSSVAKDATDATGAVIDQEDCVDALVGPTGLYCTTRFGTNATVLRTSLQGTDRQELATFEEGLGGTVVQADDTHVYYVASDLPSLDGHPLWQIPVDGGAPVAVACDRHQLAIADTDGPYPTSRGLILEQVVVSGSTLLWLEIRTEDAPPSLYSAAL